MSIRRRTTSYDVKSKLNRCRVSTGFPPLSRVTVSIKYSIEFGRLVLEITSVNIRSSEDNYIKLSFKCCKATVKHQNRTNFLVLRLFPIADWLLLLSRLMENNTDVCILHNAFEFSWILIFFPSENPCIMPSKCCISSFFTFSWYPGKSI